MSTRAEPLPKNLVVLVLVLTVAVLGLGGAVIALRLRPEPLPANTAAREVVLWQRAVEDAPDSDTAYTGLGIALKQAGRDAEARTAFERAIELNAKNWMAPFQLGLLEREVDPARAIDLLGSSAKLAPPDQRAVILIALGDTLLEQGRVDDAGNAYRKSIIFNPFTFDAHFGYGTVLERQGELKEALREFQEAGRFAPGDERVAEAVARVKAAIKATS
jgi:tetratricopeptide (TPR) repeat protein